MVLRILLTWLVVSPTGLSPSLIGFPTPFGYDLSIVRRSPYPTHISICGLASFAFARHYSQNLGWFLFLWVLRCFSSPRSPPEAMYLLQVSRFFTVSVSTFGNLRIYRLFAAPRSLSQLVTSFFGSWCQGIHLMLLFAWTSFSRSITFVAMIDPWFSFFRIAWVSWTFGYLYSLVKRFASLHFFLALFRIFHLSVKLYRTFVLT